jgi:hypothetical protein
LALLFDLRISFGVLASQALCEKLSNTIGGAAALLFVHLRTGCLQQGMSDPTVFLRVGDWSAGRCSHRRASPRSVLRRRPVEDVSYCRLVLRRRTNVDGGKT